VLEGRLSDKVDVYSFGVVLLEVVSGRKNIDPNLSPEKIYLPRWVSPNSIYYLIFAGFDRNSQLIECIHQHVPYKDLFELLNIIVY